MSSTTIPTGSYVIMNAKTHTYLNVLNFQPVPGAIVNSVGNHLGNDIWNVASTESSGMTIQSFGTGGFLSFSSSVRNVVTSNSIYSWTLQQNAAVPYAWNIVDKVTGNALAVENNSSENGAQVLEENNDGTNPGRAWFFIAKEPESGTN